MTTDLNEWSAAAAAWCAANLERRPAGAPRRHEVEYYTPEIMATNRALQRRTYEAGYAGISIAKEYGGQGLPIQFEAEWARISAPYLTADFGVLTGTTYGICLPTIIAHGAPEFLAEFVPKVLAGEQLICQFFSEPSSGSDLAGARTSAKRDGDQWIINGQKIWSTFAQLADVGFCLARTNWDVAKHRGLTWFIVACDAPGLTIRPIRQITDTSEFCEEFFDDVPVPDRNRIGDVDQGWTVSQTMLVYERGGGRATDVGNVRLPTPGPLVPDIVELARRAGATGDAVVRQKIARAHTNDFASKMLASRIAEMGRAGALNAGVASYGKLFEGTFNPIRGRILMEVAGSGAMTWDPADEAGDHPSRAYLNGRIMSIAGGTNEVQRNGIGERALGLPREPSFDSTKPFSEVVRDSQNWSGKVS
ncbi:MAG: acyl-CoA dehydrogenase family protein [Acidimicrobiia bacterium]